MLKRYKFQTKLFLSYSVVVFVIVAVIFIMFYIYISGNIYTDTEKNLEQLCQKTISQIDIMITDLDRTALFIVTNPFTSGLFEQYAQIQSISGDKAADGFSITDQFKEMIARMNVPIANSFHRISIYNNQGDYISAGFPDDPVTVQNRLESQTYGAWLANLDAGQKRIILPPHDDFWSSNKEFRPISVIRGLYNLETYQQYGIIEIQGPYKELVKTVAMDTNDNMVSTLLDQKGNLIYTSGSGMTKDAASFYYNNLKNQKNDHVSLKNPVTGKNEIVSFKRSELSGWTYMISVPKSSLLTTVKIMGSVLFLTAIGIILITIFVLFFLSRQMAKPLNMLRNSVRNVSIENLSINLDITDENNEINQLNEAFNAMFKRLRESMDELVVMHSHEIKAHMIALQSQIDPHFIYNTLSLVTAYSRDIGSDKVTEITARLSSMLRYITSYNEDFVRLDRELQHVENYLALMKLRYEEQFDFKIEIDENIAQKNITIPKLTLQPIVENSFHHGLKEVMPPWLIHIKAYIKDNLWILEINDNGTGISDDQIKKIYQKVDDFTKNPAENIKELKLGGMGLINTIVRLRLLYKKDFILNIENGDNGVSGCKITIGGAFGD